MSKLQRTMLKGCLPNSGITGRSVYSDKISLSRDYKPSVWSDFFAEKDDVIIDSNRTYRVYRTKQPQQPGPLLLLMHGGGFSGLTWAPFCVEICRLIHCQCLAFDFRGHGNTHTNDEEDLSADTLVDDIADLLKKLYEDKVPPLYLIGHSMGGAIAVHFTSKSLVPNIMGITVIDVVEGTALEALASMQNFLRTRPTYFKSIPNAIEWSVRSGQTRNLDSAKISMPGQIMNCVTKKPATCELPLTEEGDCSYTPGTTKPMHPQSIKEDEEEIPPISPSINTIDDDDKSPPKCVDLEKVSKPNVVDNFKRYTWRTDLSKSEKYWLGWFTGLSEKFLSLYIPKQLLLASIDRLDKPLMVGQMQGKFQMTILARCGHAVHEDRPHEVADVVSAYLIRNRISQAT